MHPDSSFLASSVGELPVDPADRDAVERFAGGDEALRRRALKRLALGDALVHITNRCTVLGRTFYVDRRVYRPSVRTAEMVRYALDRIEDGESILDIGTGCGFIAITAKLEKPRSRVQGVDIDDNAVDVARHNAMLHGVDVGFVASDFVESRAILEPDVVIANLPYGTPDPSKSNPINAHMPKIALYHPGGPFRALTELLESLARRSWRPVIYVETGTQPRDVVAAAMPAGTEWERIELGPSFAIVRLRANA